MQNIKNRWYSHVYEATKRTNSSKTKFANAIVKYGESAFVLSVVCRANNRFELNNRELAAIKLFDSIKKGYNTAFGGNVTKPTEETRIKMSLAGKGKKKPIGFSEKLRAANLGKKRPQWAKDRMSEAQKNSPAHINKKHLQETKLKISVANKGKIRNKEHRKNLSLANKGKKLLKETKDKMSISRIGRKPNQRAVRCITNGETYISVKIAAESLKISLNSLQHHLKGKIKTAQGYLFEYA